MPSRIKPLRRDKQCPNEPTLPTHPRSRHPHQAWDDDCAVPVSALRPPAVDNNENAAVLPTRYPLSDPGLCEDPNKLMQPSGGIPSSAFHTLFALSDMLQDFASEFCLDLMPSTSLFLHSLLPGSLEPIVRLCEDGFVSVVSDSSLSFSLNVPVSSSSPYIQTQSLSSVRST